ncbi:hypothetical protein CK203_021824 [Vitis vinifera]|uniref:Ubiquitin-like protease family profile domain-containing protein n=1 Tax=Vitis vinifera TaxID=29760 RepID=A0A438JFH0_VITVI|nr:hypothetical protein CK203_021824 [Vitis vinifera]
MNLRFNAYSPRINEWGDDEVSRMKRKIKTLGGYDDPKVTIWIMKIGQSVDIEQNNEDGDKQDAKVHEQQEEGHRVEEKSLMGMEEAFEKLKKFVLQTNVSNMDEKERLSENDSCGDMELHVSPIVNNQCHDEKIIPMSILPNLEDSHSLSTLESLVVAYVFDVSLDKSELLVNFQYEHASRADFLTLGPRQELLDVIINVFACKLNSFENKFKGIRPTRCYLPTTFAVEECAHFFNLNGHLKNLSSVPIEIPTWVDVQANGWDCGVHVINHMRRSDFMDSSSTPSHWDSTSIRHKLAIKLLLDDENSEKAIILDKVQNHAKIREEETCSRNSGCKVVHGDLH